MRKILLIFRLIGVEKKKHQDAFSSKEKGMLPGKYVISKII
jgi:hypothetical protein